MERQNGQERAVWASLRELTRELQPDGTLHCPTNHPLYPQERRAEQDGTIRIVYAARIRDCRACPLRLQCLADGIQTKHARRVSAVLRPIEGPSPHQSLRHLLEMPPSRSCGETGAGARHGAG